MPHLYLCFNMVDVSTPITQTYPQSDITVETRTKSPPVPIYDLKEVWTQE